MDEVLQVCGDVITGDPEEWRKLQGSITNRMQVHKIVSAYIYGW